MRAACAEHDHLHHVERGLEAAQKAAGVEALKLNAAVQVEGGAMLRATHDPSAELHSLIGVALVLGFVFMLLVDQIGGSVHSRASSGGECALESVLWG